MRRALPALSFASLLTLAPACNTTSQDEPELFRAGFEVSVQLTAADGGDDDGSILWEIVETEVYEGTETEGSFLLYTDGNGIRSAETNQQTCAIQAPSFGVLEAVDASSGQVVLTVWNDTVIQGEIDTKAQSSQTKMQMQLRLGDQLLLEYEDTGIYLGAAEKGNLLVTADADLTSQNQTRQLLIAAVLTGECGADGLPGYTF